MIQANWILILKYIAATLLLIGVVLAPAWIARQNKKAGIDMVIVRMVSWILWLTGLAWFISLFWASKK